MKNMIKIALILLILLLVTLLLPTIKPALNVVIGIGVNMFIAAGLAYVSYPIVKWLKKHKIPNAIAATLTLLLFVAIFTVCAVLIVQLIYPQIIRAIQVIQNSSNELDWFRDNPDLNKIYTYLEPYMDRFGQTALNYSANLTQNIISSSTKLIADFALISCLYLYILFDSEKIVKRIKKRLVYGTKNYEFVKSLNQEYLKYLKGLVIIIIITIFEYGIIYFLIGHPDWKALAALCAFSNLIPYFGGIIVNVIALITSVFVNPPYLLIKVAACVIILPTIEGNILNPMIHKRTVRISPIALLPAIFIGGSVFGFLGIILSIPAIIFIKLAHKFYGDDIKQTFVKMWNH